MPDKKLTDNEIVSTLQKNIRDSERINSSYALLNLNLLKENLDLINRQKAEVEMWKKNCDDLYEQMSERQKAEVEIAKRMGKAEAYKEFAKRLKMRAINRYNEFEDYQEYPYATITHIDELLKDLVNKE